MLEAVNAGESKVALMVDSIIEESPNEPLTALLDWAASHRELAGFYFDPSRVHLPLSESSRAILGRAVHVPDLRVMDFEALRTMIGLQMRGPEADLSFDDLSSWAPTAMELLHRAHEAVGTNHPDAATPALDVKAADLESAVAAQTVAQETEPRRGMVRGESARLVLAAGAKRWSFRSLSDACDIPLAALHAMGSRTHHLKQAVVDVMVALLELGQQSNDNRVEAIASLPFLTRHLCPTIFGDMAEVIDPQAMAEVRHRTSVRSVVEIEALRPYAAPLMNLGNAVLISSYLRRETEPDGWDHAAPLAASMVRLAGRAAS